MQLKRRHDLIPNLVETVKGYAAHEKATLEAVVAGPQRTRSRRKDAGPEQQAQAENVLTGALKQLFAVSEAYPDLKANQNFLNLQEELTSTEDRIAYSRQFYNDSVHELQQQDPDVPVEHHRRHVQLQAARVLQGRSRARPRCRKVQF